MSKKKRARRYWFTDGKAETYDFGEGETETYEFGVAQPLESRQNSPQDLSDSNNPGMPKWNKAVFQRASGN